MSRTPLIAAGSLALSSPPAASVRGVIDSLVQGSLVDLFTAYGVAVAPLPRISGERAPALPDVSAVAELRLRGTRQGTGRVTLSLPSSVLELMRATDEKTLKEDWARELCNQLAGRLKNRMLPFSLRFDVGLLSSADSQAVARQLQASPGTRVYAVRTLRGAIVATLAGMPDERELVYVGAAPTASEGEAIWF
jgi:hypothetical protein